MVSLDDVQTNDVLEDINDASNNIKNDASQNSVDSKSNSENDVPPNNIESPNSNEVTISQTDDNTVPTDNQIDENKASHLSISSTSVVNGKNLYFYLKNSAGKGISGQKVTITFANKKYTKTTDSNGQFNLNINSKIGQYPVTITYDGNEDYLASNASFKINVYKEKTIISVSSTSIAREKYLYIYLKNSAGKGISGQKVTITFANKKYTKTTDSNGRISLKMDYKATKYYTAKVKYAESTSYLASSKSFKVKIYKQKTKISVSSTSIVRGNYMHIFLKDANNNPISSKAVTIKFNKKYFKKYTNKKGEVTLKIISKAGRYPVKIKYAGSASYLSSSKSFTATSYLDKTKIEVSNSKIIKGNYLYIYLKNSANKAISNQKIEINFNNKKYSKTTNSNGRVSLKIDAKSNSYKTTIKYHGSTSYLATSKTLTINVFNNAKIIAANKTTHGDYTVRLVTDEGVPISNELITLYVYNGTPSIGSGINITTKKIILNSDNIYNKERDLKLLNDIATILRSKGYNVTVNSNIGPNAHCNDINVDNDTCIFCIFGGADSGMFLDMASKWYQYYLNTCNNRVVLGFTKTMRNLATETFLERAHDDNYSPSNFTGLANPGTYLNENGFDYVYGDTAAQIAENFLEYAVNGLSIGKDNILPGTFKTYTAITNENGYASISGLSEGCYTVISSCSSASEYLVESVTSYLTVT